PLRCRIGRTAPSVIGSRNLLDCQAVANGPVSASPSPTMQATMSPGLSNAAPKAWLSDYPSSPPPWMEPGVDGATWLEMPPGKENCLNSGFVLADVGIDFAVAALEIGVGGQGRPAMSGTGDVDHVEIVQSDRPVQMDVNEVLPWRRSPMPDHQRFDMRQRER